MIDYNIWIPNQFRSKAKKVDNAKGIPTLRTYVQYYRHSVADSGCFEMDPDPAFHYN